MPEKVAVVVAGGSGMGAAAARRLAREGFRVAILSSSGKGEALGKQLGGIGVTGSNLSSEDLGRLVRETLDRWGRIDVLVNGAAHGPRAPVLELTDEQWHMGLDVYLLNVIPPTRLVTPVMVGQGGAVIINISTAWIFEPQSDVSDIGRLSSGTCCVHQALCRRIRCQQRADEQCLARLDRQLALEGGASSERADAALRYDGGNRCHHRLPRFRRSRLHDGPEHSG